MGVARSTACKYLAAMGEQGMVAYDSSESTTDKIRRLNAAQTVGVYAGSIPCGAPETVEAMVEDHSLRHPRSE